MFDIGFWELVIIATVALLVVGPEKLPAFARQAGKWMAKFRNMANNLQREFKQELSIDEDKAFKDKIEDLDDLMKNAPDKFSEFTKNLTKENKNKDGDDS